jgi:hypothetical protein
MLFSIFICQGVIKYLKEILAVPREESAEGGERIPKNQEGWEPLG